MQDAIAAAKQFATDSTHGTTLSTMKKIQEDCRGFQALDDQHYEAWIKVCEVRQTVEANTSESFKAGHAEELTALATAKDAYVDDVIVETDLAFSEACEGLFPEITT